MPSPATFPTYDRLVPGGLEAFLRQERDEGRSLRSIVAKLQADHHISVSVETVRGWLRACDIPTERPEAIAKAKARAV